MTDDRDNVEAPAETPARGPGELLYTAPDRLWYLLVGLSAIALLIGVYCFWYQDHYHFITTGLRNLGFGGAPWGMHVGFYVIFVGISFAGITIATLTRLFEIKVLEPITRLAQIVTITVLVGGSAAIIADLGRPFDGLIKLPRYARPESPFYGTFTLVVAGYLFSSLVYFFLTGRADAARMSRRGPRPLRLFYRIWASGYRDTPDERRRHRRTTFWLAVTMLPLLMVAHSTLGFIFGLQAGRPGWYSALQAPAFVVLADISGTGALILVALGMRKLFGLGQAIPDSALRWLGNFMWILAAIYLYLMVAEELTAVYAGPAADRDVAHSVVSGPYARYFWITVISLGACFLIPFVMFARKRVSMGWLALASAGGIIGAVTKRLLIIVPSQTHGAQIQLEPGVYAPTWVEYGFVVGLGGLIALAMLMIARFFPLVPTAPPAEQQKRQPPRDWLRVTMTSAWAAVAVALITVGLMDSFRVWSGPGEIDPRIPYSPVIFAFGVMMLFSSAIVYETLPADSAAGEASPTPAAKQD